MAVCDQHSPQHSELVAWPYAAIISVAWRFLIDRAHAVAWPQTFGTWEILIEGAQPQPDIGIDRRDLDLGHTPQAAAALAADVSADCYRADANGGMAPGRFDCSSARRALVKRFFLRVRLQRLLPYTARHGLVSCTVCRLSSDVVARSRRVTAPFGTGLGKRPLLASLPAA